jgi:hypothetical protein
MGGFGSGRGTRSRKKWSKLIISVVPKLYIPDVVKKSTDGNHCTWEGFSVTLEGDKVRLAKEGEKDILSVILKTPCHYGGYRYACACPRCGRHVKSLYKLVSYIGCRHCFRLTYFSQNRRLSMRLYSKKKLIEEKLNGDVKNKPKWMRWPTFEKLSKQHHVLDEQGQVADFFCLRNKKQAEKILKKHGYAFFAIEDEAIKHWGPLSL